MSCSKDGTRFDYGGFRELFIPLLGLYQPLNAANVIEAALMLRTRGLRIADRDIRRGLASASWKGRFEKLSESPLVFFDGGHNTEGVTAAVDTVKRYFGGKKINILSGVMADKRYREMAELISGVAERVYTVAPDNARALDAESYAAVFRELGVPAKGYPGYEAALEDAIADCLVSDRPLLALGSLYAYAPFKKALYKKLYSDPGAEDGE